jgi:integrase
VATIVERQAGTGSEKDRRRLYVVFWATDRATGKRRKVWELQPSTLKNDANDRKRAIETALRKSGGLWPAEQPQEAPVTVAAYAEEFLAAHARKASDRVVDGYRDTFRVHLTPRFGDRPVTDTRRRDVNEYVGELVDAGKARNTIRNILTPLRLMFAKAVDDELRDTNPADGIDIPDSATVRHVTVPTREQLNRIIRAARSQDDRDAITVMAALGLRIGECFGLRWADVDFQENLVTVRSQNHNAAIVDRTKTKAGTRLVPLFPSARVALEARRRRLTPHPTAYVFANAIGGPIHPGNWRRREWLPALKKAGYEKQFVPHSLRHFAATALDEQGMVGKLRTEVIGHANEEVTNSIYTHVRRSRVAAVAGDFDPLR